MITPTGKNLIFLISQPRSGSTLLQRIIAGCPAVHTTAEPWIMLPLLDPLRAEGHTADYDSQLAHTALGDFCDTLPGGQHFYRGKVAMMAASLYTASLPTGKSIFLDKTPRYYQIIPDLRKTFSEAKFIFLTRNPLAVLASIIDTWSGTEPAKLGAYQKDLEVAPDLIAGAIREGFGIQVDYDTLVIHPEFTMKRVCHWLSLPYDPRMLDYGSSPAPHGSMGDPVGIAKHYRPVVDSVNKWKQTFSKPLTWSIADEYLTKLSEGACEAFSYPKDYLQGQLNSIRPV